MIKRACIDSRCSYGQHDQVPDHEWVEWEDNGPTTLPDDGRYPAGTPDEIAIDKAILRKMAADPTTPDLLDDLLRD